MEKSKGLCCGSCLSSPQPLSELELVNLPSGTGYLCNSCIENGLKALLKAKERITLKQKLLENLIEVR